MSIFPKKNSFQNKSFNVKVMYIFNAVAIAIFVIAIILKFFVFNS